MPNMINATASDYLKRIMQPNTSTSSSTTKLTDNQGIDLSSLLMMLMFSGLFDKNKTAGTSTGLTSPLLGGASATAGLPNTTAEIPNVSGGAGSNAMSMNQLLQILQALGGLSQNKSGGLF